MTESGVPAPTALMLDAQELGKAAKALLLAIKKHKPVDFDSTLAEPFEKLADLCIKHRDEIDAPEGSVGSSPFKGELGGYLVITSPRHYQYHFQLGGLPGKRDIREYH